MGKLVEVEIIECTKFSMKGKLVDENLHKQPNQNMPFKKGEIRGNMIKSIVKIRIYLCVKIQMINLPSQNFIHLSFFFSFWFCVNKIQIF